MRQARELMEVGLGENVLHLGPRVGGEVLLVASSGQIPGLAQQSRLVTERSVDRLDGHA